MMNLKFDKDKIVLCAKNTCCPTLKKVDNDQYMLEDKGQVILLDSDQIALIANAKIILDDVDSNLE